MSAADIVSRSAMRRAQIIAVLAVTQLIGWGTGNDMMGVLGRKIAPDLHVTNEIAFMGLGLGLIVSALMGPTVGGWLKRYGAAQVLSGGSVVLASGLGFIALSQGPISYFCAWGVMGVGSALGLSAAAYTAIVERQGGGAKQTIASLMILTGLSSAIFWPIISALHDAFGWRTTCWMLASLHIVICLPLHLFALPRPIVHSSASQTAVDRAPLQLTPRERTRVFLLIAAATTLFSFMGVGVSACFLELLRRAGATPAQALQLGSMRSVLTISARLGDMLLGKRSTPVTSAMAACGFILAGCCVLLAFTGSWVAIVLFVVLNGFGAGIAALARVLLPLSFFAVSDYGRQASRLTLPQNFANAAAPAIFTALLDHGDVATVLNFVLILAGSALVAILGLAAMERRYARAEATATA